eukprot:CAMPEP_0201521526 /NCGR_PEP_ID=MMETSP0161_2-20130828/14553_1 /ASSEMBLY_ACC=CAM_ASM_000251 /TAXON_ID=180227 /ORGANISM="Neoparamoeba aestuarina, Strain SoJaBio B1-5/56/2" /LENGTH=415 /DNA_ID=CAMNT_0047920173 /DNA_START=188 /DNA_END=1435 /DNA_ORIENTATION=-
MDDEQREGVRRRRSVIVLNEIGNVRRHLLDLGVVKSFNFVKKREIFVGHKVDGNTLTTETTGSTDSVDVALQVLGDVVVDDQRNLLDINTTRQQISGDKDTRRPAPELLQNDVTVTLRDVTMGGGDDKLSALHLLSQPVDLPSCVAKDNGLGDVDGIVQITQGLEFVLVDSNINVELLDTFKGQLSSLDQNLDRVVHESLSNFKSFLGHGGREETDMHVTGEGGEDGVDLVAETSGQHIISLIKNEDFDGVRAKNVSAQHIVHTTGGSNNNVNSLLEFLNVMAHPGTTNAGVAVSFHVNTQRVNNFLDLLGQLTGRGKDKSLALKNGGVDLLEDTDGEGGSLSGTRLGLGDCVITLDKGKDGSLLDSRRTFETHGVNTTKEISFQVHIIKVINDLFFVGTRSIISRFNNDFISHN